MTAVLPFVPFQPFAGEWTAAAREALTDAALARLDEAVPGLKQAVAGTRLLLPADYEEMLGLGGGSWVGVPPSPDRLWAARPLPALAQYRAPLKGLYLGGPDQHPGGIACAAGLNAAEAVLADAES
jgi:phytoene dehydrogenase-like protein